MSKYIKRTQETKNHPKFEGVILRHFFTSEDNDRLNNMEVKILPGYSIFPHIHENSGEYFYVVSGEAQFSIDGDKINVKPGDVMFAPRGIEHGFYNPSETEAFVLFSTFSPAIR